MMQPLCDRVLDYEKHFSESQYLNDLVSSVSTTDLFATIVQLLQTADQPTILTTLLFIQDLILWYPDEKRKSIRTDYENSSVVRAIEALLITGDHWTRKQAGYVLGKTGSCSSLPAMTAAFYHWLDRDPLMLPHLLGELGWLGAENFDTLRDAMLESPTVATRWGAIRLVEDFYPDDDEPLRQDKQSLWDKLRQDSNPLVRQEAEYAYQIQYLRLHQESLDKTTRRKQRKEIERQYTPKINYDRLSCQFEFELSQSGKLDYSIEELKAYIPLSGHQTVDAILLLSKVPEPR
jgi:hypothetical protein